MTYKTIMTEKVGTKSINKGSFEKIRKNHKCHRNILYQEIGFTRKYWKRKRLSTTLLNYNVTVDGEECAKMTYIRPLIPSSSVSRDD